MDFKAIGIGWGRWLGLVNISEAMRQESERRLKICEGCDFAKPSTFLEFINDGVNNVEGKFCSICKCPCHQKSLTDNVCKLGKWDITKQ